MATVATNIFTVREYPARSCWIVDIGKGFAGRRIRLFADSEADAYRLGDETIAKIRSKGIDGLKPEPTGATMRGLTAEFVKRNRGKSKSHTQKVSLVSRALCKKFDFVAVAPRDLDAWLRGLPVSETTRALYYRYTRMFFRWAHRMEYIDRDPSLALDAPKASVRRNILTPAQMQEVLAVDVPPWMRACLLLAAFGGLRTSELLRMDWSDIDAKSGQIHVRPGVMKNSGGFDQRIVDFTGPLKRRKLSLDGKGKLVPCCAEVFHRHRKTIAAAAGLGDSWPDNCLRHSFATYHLGQCKNPALTAFQMGHTSPAMVQRVYAVPAVRADWLAWWAI